MNTLPSRIQPGGEEYAGDSIAHAMLQFGGEVHDLINLLAVIDCYAEASVRTAAKKGAGLKEAQTIRDTAVKAARLARGLLDSTRQRGPSPLAIDINQVIRSNASTIESLAGVAISVICKLEAVASIAKIEPDELSQVLLNLISNSRDAMPRGGIIRISTANTAHDAHWARSNVRADYVILTVTDSGTGMDASTRQRVFEPFFTTKPSTKGSGLGLTSVHNIIERCCGFVRVLSKPGLGTSFAIHLPRAAS